VLEGGKAGQRGELRILDAQGRTVMSHEFRFAGSVYETALFRAQLPAGIYEAVVGVAGRMLSNRRFVIASEK
jgi:hypothetical protein